MNSGSKPVIRFVVLFAVLMAGMLGAQAAQAAGTPDLQLASTSDSPLYGQSSGASAAAALANGQPKGYNLSFRAVLPAGITYTGGAAFPPQVINNAPTAGKTTLIFSNISDLVANSTQAVALNLTHDPNLYEVGDTYNVEWEAFVNTDPRYEPKFNSTGTVIAGTYTGSATSTSTSTINAIKVTKSEPSREGEILRGVHDNQTIYTLKLENNSVNPTAATTLDDYLPAGLEFLGCAGTPDSTTDAPTNPGSNREYPGAPAIVVQPVPDCFAPVLVETVQIDPDLAGPMPFAVYTHVRWNTGTLAPAQIKTYRYRAAVPLAENTLAWTGTQPTPASGNQATNLDNNSGPEIRDEQDLTNYAIGKGTYTGRNGAIAVSSDARLSRTAEDLVVYKSNSTELGQGDITTWELRFRTGEYRYSDDIVVTDTLPSGLCPLGPVNYTTQNDPSDAECDPTGDNPSVPYKTVAENANGTFTIIWDKTVLAKLGHTNVNDEFVITFPTKTRTNYQSNFLPSTPILAKDGITNNVSLTGDAFSRCTAPGTPDCSITGPRIWGPAGNPEPVVDASSAGQEAPTVALTKEVSTGSTNCTTATYGKTLPVYRPGDKVCWRLTIDFPAKVDTNELTVTDFLPVNSTFIPGSIANTAANTITNTPDVSEAANGVINWSLGGFVAVGSQKFQVTLATTTTPVGFIDPSDIKGNLMKFAIQNTVGQAFPLRDQVNFEVIPPMVSIKKGVRQVNSGPIQNPPADGLTVRADDVATYQVDVKSTGDTKQVQVWDRLPAAFDCTAVTAISDGGICVDGGAGRDVIKWTVPAIADGATKSLTYKVQIPSDVGPENNFVNESGVREYKAETNQGTDYTYTPLNNIDPVNPNTPNIARVDDPSNVLTPNVAINKTRTTSITETGNDANTQATIGETINYTVTTTLPGGTTMKINPRIVDTPDSATTQPIVGTPTATLNGNPLPVGWSITTVGQTVTVQMPDNYVVPNGTDHVVRMFISTRVADVSANVRSQNRTNQATVLWTDTSDRSRNSNSVSTTIVEPSISQTKTNSVQPNAVPPGSPVTYTLTTRNSSSSNVSIAHDTVIRDVVPAGMTLVDAGDNPLADGAVVPGTGGATWDLATRTITGPAIDINPGASVVWTYKATVDSPPIAGTNLVNTADATTTSINGTDTNERTAASSTNTGYTASSSSPVTINGASVVKSVDPAWATIGTPVTYTVDLTIPKNLTMFNLTAVDTLPDSVDFDSYTSATCVSGCPASPAPTVQTYNPVVTPSATTIAWDLGNITPGTTDRVIRFVFQAHVRDTFRSSGVKVKAGDNIVNTVRAQSNLSDKFSFNPNSLPAVNTFDYVSPNATVTTPVREPSVTLDKRVKVNSGAFVNGPVQSQPGDSLTYSVAVTNSGTSAAYDMVVTDKPDTKITNVVLVQGAAFNTDPWTQADPTMKWTIPGPIAPGDTVTLTYTAEPLPAAQLSTGDSAINTAGSNYWGLPLSERTNPWTYRNYDSNNDTVRVDFEFPEISVNKTTTAAGFPDIANAPVLQPFGWRIVVTNNATTARALDTVVTDTLPPAWSYDADSTTITGATGGNPAVAPNPAGDVLTWNFTGQTIQPGGTVTIVFTATPQVAAGLNPPVQVNNAAAASKDASGSDRNLSGPYTDNDDASANLLIPNLAIDKSHAGNFNRGQIGASYTIAVTNNGPAATNGLVTVTDTLPTGLTATAISGTGWNCTLATLTCTRSDVLAANASYPNITMTVNVANDAPASIINSATVTGGGDPTPSTDDDPTTIRLVNLAIDKSHAGNFNRGQIGAEYMIAVTNTGPDASNGLVTVTDTLPTGLTATAISGTGWNCVLATLTCTRSDVLVANASYPNITMTVDVANNAPASIINSATVSGGGDPTPSTDDDPTTIRLINLAIDKSHTGNFTQGQTGATYAIAVTNAGPDATNGLVSVTDALPTGLTATAISGTGWNCTLATLTCTRSDVLAANASYPNITMTVNVANNAPANIINSATVSGGGDPTPSTDDDPTTVGSINLAINKSHTGNFNRGQIGAEYMIAVTNTGPDGTSGLVTVTDTLPTGLTATAISGTGWNCTLATLTCTRSDVLAANASYPNITMTVNVANNAPASIINSATVSGGGDPTPSTDDDPTTVDPSADLVLTKSAPATAKVGDQFDYVMLVENKGPDGATDVELNDPLPTGLTFVSSDDCNSVMVCMLGSIASGDSRMVTVTVEVTEALAGTTVVNTAVVNGAEFDPTPEDNTDTVSTVIGLLANLKVSKTGPAQAQAGSRIGWNIVVENLGPNAAEGVVLDDPLPAGLTNPTVTTEQGTCDLTVKCVIGPLPVGGSVLVTIEADIPRGVTVGSTISNTATVTSDTPEKDPSDNTSTAITEVTKPTPLGAKIAITKELRNKKVTVGDVVTFKLTAKNSGDAPATNVVMKDSLNPKLRYINSAVPGGTCSFLVTTVTCRVPKLAAGKSVTATIHALALEPGQVVNTGTIQADNSTIIRRKSTVRFPIVKGQTRIGIVKTAMKKQTRDGGRITFQIEVSNQTNQPAFNVKVCDLLPGGTTVINSKKGREMAGGKLCWTIDYLPGGASREAWVTLRVDKFISIDELTNVATVAAGNVEGVKQAKAKVDLIRVGNAARGGGVTG